MYLLQITNSTVFLTLKLITYLSLGITWIIRQKTFNKTKVLKVEFMKNKIFLLCTTTSNNNNIVISSPNKLFGLQKVLLYHTDCVIKKCLEPRVQWIESKNTEVKPLLATTLISHQHCETCLSGDCRIHIKSIFWLNKKSLQFSNFAFLD